VNVTVAEVLAGAEVRAVPLSAECVGYLILAAADQVGAAPRRIGPSDLLLFEDGGVRVTGGRATDALSAEADLRSVLDVLLLRASAPTSGLLRASRRKAGAGVEALVRELETALIPVNRAAAKRALARLERETVRALESGRISRVPPPPESVVPPNVAPVESVEPPSVSALEESVSPLEVAMTPEPSTVAPPMAAARARHSAVAVEVVAWSPSPETVALVEHTIVMAPVAPKPEPEPPLAETRPEPVVLRASQRPPAPPVGAALPAPAHAEPVRTEPLPRVASHPPGGLVPAAVAPAVAVLSPAAPNVTPILGTRVSAPEPAPLALEALEPDPFVVEPPEPAPFVVEAPEPEPFVVEAPEPEPFVVVVPEPAPLFVLSSAHDAIEESDIEESDIEESDIEPFVAESFADEPALAAPPEMFFEVTFEPEEQTMLPVDEELVYSQGADWTEPCPPLEPESMLPTPDLTTLAASVGSGLPPNVESSFPPNVESSFPPNVESSFPPNVESSFPPESDASSIESSALPPWMTAVADVHTAVTPPPRVAMPSPRPSDVDDLLARLVEAPIAVDELRSGLRRLAGMEPTPPPPGTAPSK
jgi:hypothetical protein